MRFRAGDPRARAAVRSIAQRASAGDPRAKRVARLLAQHCPCPPGGAAAGASLVTGCGGYPAAVGAWEGLQWIAQELRPHSPIRPGADAFTMRKAYRGGIEAISNL
jgi:hypothetical protein